MSRTVSAVCMRMARASCSPRTAARAIGRMTRVASPWSSVACVLALPKPSMAALAALHWAGFAMLMAKVAWLRTGARCPGWPH